jgi:hypothetical protein
LISCRRKRARIPQTPPPRAIRIKRISIGLLLSSRERLWRRS